MIRFIEEEITVADIPKGGSIVIEFPFEGDKSEIKDVQPGCSCTAKCKVEGNKVIATYTDTSGVVNKKDFPNGYPYKKHINVFLEDSTTQINGMTKTRSKITLYFNGKVIL